MEEGNTKSLYPFLVSINSLEKKMEELIREFRIRQVRDPQYIILDNADFIRMFNISSRTAQNWRDEGLIEYAQVKGKFYYSLTDIKNFIDKHRKNKKGI
ncbi:helix-turn-helix domain-containing protein [Antarcticibacterium arcticum]|uniref:Helix-turn-helix domain-containing protein n=1 Tax=Antarcticibacterium arcticum TaxID=2585771 RepID=A0A5B8YLS5_9FLAO|nr:helix-turn-helix domain-containing protein [Antarcticibacterium arcticum]QED38960.1 helix-turn-helix domain-containing protein [Antarcticibacterium arcticum]